MFTIYFHYSGESEDVQIEDLSFSPTIKQLQAHLVNMGGSANLPIFIDEIVAH